MSIPVYNTDGKQEREIDAPRAFSYKVKAELIRRAVISESSYSLQPQGHFVLAGMQTTATYFGAMNEYRSGRHMGIAIRPREKLGGGRQGKVKRIPSAVKGKRAHPHKVEKTLIEKMNNTEYRNALASSIAASNSVVVSDGIESIKKTKDAVKLIGVLKLSKLTGESASKHLSKGLSRGSRARHYTKALLFVVRDDKGIVKAARNIAGVSACTLKQITASAFAPGGNGGRTVIWSESAVKGIDTALTGMSVSEQAKYARRI